MENEGLKSCCCRWLTWAKFSIFGVPCLQAKIISFFILKENGALKIVPFPEILLQVSSETVNWFLVIMHCMFVTRCEFQATRDYCFPFIIVAAVLILNLKD